MTVFTEELHTGGYVVSEAEGTYCRDEVTIAESAKLFAGQVLGKITLGAQTVHAAVAFAGNVTNDSVSAPSGTTGAMAGDYKVVGTTAGATGEFEVLRPDGTLDGEGKVGAAYAGSIGFTITDGSTHLAVGDGWTITVSYAAGSGKYVMQNPSATDGSQNAAAILYTDADASAADAVQTAHVRGPMAFNASEIIWMAGMSGPQIAAATAQLAALGMIAR